MTKNDLASIFARWAIILQQYTFSIVHRPGEQHQNADGLSRQPQESSMDASGARLHDEYMHAPKCRLLACPECVIHASRDIKLWYGHSCSLRQGVRVLHDAATTHPFPSVAARLLPTQTITKFVLHGETKRCSCPATGKAKSREIRGIWKREKLGKHLKHNPLQITHALRLRLIVDCIRRDTPSPPRS